MNADGETPGASDEELAGAGDELEKRADLLVIASAGPVLTDADVLALRDSDQR